MPSAETEFWNWFAERSDAFRGEMPPELEAEMRRRLHTVHRDLSPEIIPPRDEGEDFELVLTARGVLEGFAAVVRTALAAPAVPGWRVTPFIPRSEEPLEVQVGEHVVLTADDSGSRGTARGTAHTSRSTTTPLSTSPRRRSTGSPSSSSTTPSGSTQRPPGLVRSACTRRQRTPHAKGSPPSPRSVAGSTTSSARRSSRSAATEG